MKKLLIALLTLGASVSTFAGSAQVKQMEKEFWSGRKIGVDINSSLSYVYSNLNCQDSVDFYNRTINKINNAKHRDEDFADMFVEASEYYFYDVKRCGNR